MLRIPDCIWDRLVEKVIGTFTDDELRDLVTDGFKNWHVDALDEPADRQ